MIVSAKGRSRKRGFALHRSEVEKAAVQFNLRASVLPVPRTGAKHWRAHAARFSLAKSRRNRAAKAARPTLFSRSILYAGLTVLGIALGILTAWLSVRSPAAIRSVTVGAWHASLMSGSADADIYTRARIALSALVVLNREETLYFLATTDDKGQPLRSRCSYRVSGTPPQARWWSITAYAEDMYLFANEPKRYSISSANAPLDAAGKFSVVTGPAQPASAKNWIPTPGDRGVVFTLRLYNPVPLIVANPAALHAPAIERVGDCG